MFDPKIMDVVITNAKTPDQVKIREKWLWIKAFLASYQSQPVQDFHSHQVAIDKAFKTADFQTSL